MGAVATGLCMLEPDHVMRGEESSLMRLLGTFSRALTPKVWVT